MPDAPAPGQHAPSDQPAASGHVERASAWIYSGLWAVLTNLFLVPRDPPHMPQGAHTVIASYRPAPGWLRYTKFYFWIGLLAIDIALSLLWIGATITLPILGLILALPALIVIVLPDILAYIAIHLRYDTTWYVLTDRSLRLRRGVLLLTETTITYENVQNITIEQGPIQRVFGIADLVVHTAGGSGGGGGGHHGKNQPGLLGHVGRIEGVDNPADIRELIMSRVRASRSAGLGDERHIDAAAPGAAAGPAWSGPHLATLREIRDLLAAPER